MVGLIINKYIKLIIYCKLCWGYFIILWFILEVIDITLFITFILKQDIGF